MAPIRGIERQLWICGRPWTVAFQAADLISGGAVIFADCDDKALLMRVGGNMHRAQQRSSLYHEWFHACISIAGGKALSDMPDKEEGFVRALETAAYDSWRDPRNEWFRRFILETDESLIPLKGWENLTE